MILSFELPDCRVSKWKFHRVIACLIAVAPGTYSNVKNAILNKKHKCLRSSRE